MRKVLLSLIFIALVSPLNAQITQLFNQRQPLSFPYSVRQLQSSPEAARTIIQQIARGSGIAEQQVNYQFNALMDMSLQQVNFHFQANVAFLDHSVSGNTFYRGFNMSDVMMPTNMQTTFQVVTLSGRILATAVSGDLNRFNNYTAVIPLNLPLPVVEKLELRMVSTQLFYDAQSMGFFTQRIQLINDYYAMGMLLNDEQQRINRLGPLTMDNIDFQIEQLQLAEQTINQVNARNFNQLLFLSSNDPDRLNFRINDLRNQISNRRMMMNQFYASLDSYYYNKGLQSLNNRQMGDAKRLFEKSVATNPFFAPAVYELALMDYNDGEVVEAERKLRNIVQRMQPDMNTREKSVTLLRNIYNDILDRGFAEEDKGNFEEALDYFAEAQNMCREVNGLTCRDVMFQAIARTKRNIYTRMLIEAVQQIERDNLELATDKLQQADKYQRANKSEIFKSRTDSVWAMLNVKRVEKTIREAETLLAQQNYKEALNKINQAEVEARKNKLEMGNKYYQVASAAARPLLMEQARDAVAFVQSNDRNKATQMFNSLRDSQRRYGLENDPELNNAMAPLVDYFRKGECEKVFKEIDQLKQTAQKDRESRNFVKAEETLNKAISKAQENPDCNYPFFDMQEDKEKMLPAATYQKLINRIILMQMDGKVEEAIKKYQEAQAYFYQFELDAMGMKHKDLHTFAIDNFKNSSLHTFAKQTAKKEEFDKAIQLYKTLLDRNYPAKNIRNDLYDLGEQMARVDKANGKTSGKPAERAKDYIKNDKDMKSFINGYTSVFKS
jgi:hypothetical protein